MERSKNVGRGGGDRQWLKAQMKATECNIIDIFEFWTLCNIKFFKKQHVGSEPMFATSNQLDT